MSAWLSGQTALRIINVMVTVFRSDFKAIPFELTFYSREIRSHIGGRQQILCSCVCVFYWIKYVHVLRSTALYTVHTLYIYSDGCKALVVINEGKASGERLGGKPQHLFQTLIIFMFTYSILLALIKWQWFVIHLSNNREVTGQTPYREMTN